MGESHYLGIVQVEHDIPAKHPTLCIEGEADLRVTLRTRHRYVLDVKTINNANWLKTYGIAPKHRVQLNTYLGLLGDRAGAILYENKDNQKWATPMSNFSMDFDRVMFQETEAYCEGILARLAAEDFPEFDEGVCKANLTFCSYTEVCDQVRAGNSPYSEGIDQRPDSIRHRHLAVVR
jgi:hypothetical protein